MEITRGKKPKQTKLISATKHQFPLRLNVCSANRENLSRSLHYDTLNACPLYLANHNG